MGLDKTLGSAGSAGRGPKTMSDTLALRLRYLISSVSEHKIKSIEYSYIIIITFTFVVP
jgi:hypothetical protein